MSETCKSETCKNCGGEIAVRNPRGDCDHLCWPDNLTDDAKRENGFVPVQRTVWEKPSDDFKVVDGPAW